MDDYTSSKICCRRVLWYATLGLCAQKSVCAGPMMTSRGNSMGFNKGTMSVYTPYFATPSVAPANCPSTQLEVVCWGCKSSP